MSSTILRAGCLAVCVTLISFAGSPSNPQKPAKQTTKAKKSVKPIGTLTADGPVLLRGVPVYGIGTEWPVFEGDTIHTGPQTATLRLKDGSSVGFKALSSAVVSAAAVTLTAGSASYLLESGARTVLNTSDQMQPVLEGSGTLVSGGKSSVGVHLAVTALCRNPNDPGTGYPCATCTTPSFDSRICCHSEGNSRRCKD